MYVYKITYPDEMIYVGVDWGKQPCVVSYVGSPAPDVDRKYHHLLSVGQKIVIEKEILWVGETKSEALQKEREFIKLFDATNPAIGHNKR